MKRLLKSVAFRLSIWFLLLSVLPLLVMAIFVRSSMLAELQREASDYTRQQAEIDAVFIGRLDHSMPPQEFVASSQPRNGSHFVVDLSGNYVAHPDADRKSTRLNSSHLVISYAVF